MGAIADTCRQIEIRDAAWRAELESATQLLHATLLSVAAGPPISVTAAMATHPHLSMPALLDLQVCMRALRIAEVRTGADGCSVSHDHRRYDQYIRVPCAADSVRPSLRACKDRHHRALLSRLRHDRAITPDHSAALALLADLANHLDEPIHMKRTLRGRDSHVWNPVITPAAGRVLDGQGAANRAVRSRLYTMFSFDDLPNEVGDATRAYLDRDTGMFVATEEPAVYMLGLLG